MTNDQWLRVIPWVIIGAASCAFALSTFVRTWREDRVAFWPLPFGAVAGGWLLSLGIIASVRVANIGGDFGDRTEHRIAYVALWFAALMTCWTLARWWKDDGGV